MKIRKVDGYTVPCEDCCEIHFYDDDLVVAKNTSTPNPDIVNYEDWKNLPFKEAVDYLFPDNSNWVSMMIPLYVRCPLCNKLTMAWVDRLYSTTDIGTAEKSTIRELEENGLVYIFKKLNFDDSDSPATRVYGPWEEVL